MTAVSFVTKIRISWQLVQCIWHSYCEFFLYMLCAILSNKHFSSSSSSTSLCSVYINIIQESQTELKSETSPRHELKRQEWWKQNGILMSCGLKSRNLFRPVMFVRFLQIWFSTPEIKSYSSDRKVAHIDTIFCACLQNFSFMDQHNFEMQVNAKRS